MLVNILTAVHNEERYLDAAIRSVLAQEHTDIEWLIASDGSTDRTVEIARSVNDQRIKVFDLPRQGVSRARNYLLERMRGEAFCVLDGDDVLPVRSVASRVAVLEEDPTVHFADGAVSFRNADLSKEIRRFAPTFSGDPFPHLIALDGECFCGSSWLIRRQPGVRYAYEEDLTHGEDLFFYMTLARGRRYAATSEEVLHYRRMTDSAMTDLSGLERGYLQILGRSSSLRLTPGERRTMKLRMLRFMLLGHAKVGGAPYKALRSAMRFLRA